MADPNKKIIVHISIVRVSDSNSPIFSMYKQKYERHLKYSTLNDQFQFSSHQTKFEINPHTPQDRDFHFRSGYLYNPVPCEASLPWNVYIHISQPQFTRKVASLFSARFLEEFAGTLCPILRFAKGRGQFDKAMSRKCCSTSKPKVRL